MNQPTSAQPPIEIRIVNNGITCDFLLKFCCIGFMLMVGIVICWWVLVLCIELLSYATEGQVCEFISCNYLFILFIAVVLVFFTCFVIVCITGLAYWYERHTKKPTAVETDFLITHQSSNIDPQPLNV